MNPHTTVINPEMLLLLEKEIDKYPSMTKCLDTLNMTSGGILTTTGIEMVSKAISSDLTVVTECFAFLDVIDFLCMFYSGDPDVFVTRMVTVLAASRALPKPELCGIRVAVDSYTVSKAKHSVTTVRSLEIALETISMPVVVRIPPLVMLSVSKHLVIDGYLSISFSNRSSISGLITVVCGFIA
jgi:hypothetical protein